MSRVFCGGRHVGNGGRSDGPVFGRSVEGAVRLQRQPIVALFIWGSGGGSGVKGISLQGRGLLFALSCY